MGRQLEIVTPLHKATKRDYLARMNDDKVQCMVKAKEYEFDYWDGDRRYGYGGYKFIDGRWRPVAQALVDGTFALPLAQLDAGHAWPAFFATRCRSILISQDIRTWPSGLAGCLGFIFLKISTSPTAPPHHRILVALVS